MKLEDRTQKLQLNKCQLNYQVVNTNKFKDLDGIFYLFDPPRRIYVASTNCGDQAHYCWQTKKHQQAMQ